MASITSRSYRILPYIAGATLVGAAGTAYFATRRPLMMDSSQNPPTKTLNFPSSMLFSKQLTVTSSEQVNHDTKRITFALPGGENEISGCPAGGTIERSSGLDDTDKKQLQSSHNTPHQAAGSLSSDHTRLYQTPTSEAVSRSL